MDFLPILQFRTACINVLKTPNTNDIIIFNIQQQIKSTQVKQEAQLMLTNPRDAFRSQSRPPNTVMFHMLGIVSTAAIVTLSLRRAVFLIFDFTKCHDLEIRVRGHSR